MSGVFNRILACILYLLAQVFLFNDMTLFQVATPFVFLLFLFTLPMATSTAVLYLVTFGFGITMDILSENVATGLHTFSALLAMGVRRPIVAMTASSNIRNAGDVNFASQGSLWWASFLLPLIFVHNFSYFLLEAFSFDGFFHTLWKVVASTLYTFVICYMLAYLFYKK
ncbi:hypothetical protein [Pontibacter sp. G13]|uniref:hypothetical protein n=1 Tax=Pontibacter sp. G13 TaxID=3074898 RepID=UPI00288A2BF9|nr:hypothetical protein [Pontibacter sp. G13]WNJ16711.1 hypothetical protein RJD25_17735 [Pontibacter sp. G13]